MGNTEGDNELDKSVLYMFERFIEINGLEIGRWKIFEGNGHHLFIIDTKRDGFYRFNKTYVPQ